MVASARGGSRRRGGAARRLDRIGAAVGSILGGGRRRGGAARQQGRGAAKPARGAAKPARGAAKPARGAAKPARGAAKPGRPTTCRYCGGPLPKDRRPQTRLCSDRCRKRTAVESRLHPEVRVQFEEASKAERRRRTEPKKPLYCDQCGKRIPEESMRTRYCSNACSKKGAYESYRSNPAAVELNRTRNREYARRRYATAAGKASYLAASKRYHIRLKAQAAGAEAPPEAAVRPRGRSMVWVKANKAARRSGRRAPGSSSPAPKRQRQGSRRAGRAPGRKR